MKVAYNTYPLDSGHKLRGIGKYTENLKSEFDKLQEIQFEFFSNPSRPPAADVIHYPYFDLFFRTLPLRSKVSRIVTIHDVIPLVFPNYFPAGIKGFINLYFQQRAIKNTQAIICDSETSKKDIVQKLGISANKIHVVYLAAGNNFKPNKNSLQLEKIAKKFKLPQKFVLFVGDINWNKNVMTLLESIDISKTNLIMIGKSLLDQNIPQTVSMEKKIKELKIEEKIIKLGYVSEKDLAAIYNLAIATILPSYYEGFGLPAIESMACGTPVICSNNSSLSEITGNTAIFCDPSDPNDIAKKINSVSDLSPENYKALSAKSIKQASKFSWDKTAKKTIKVYQEVVRKR